MVSKLFSLLSIRPNETRAASLLIGIMLFSAAGYSLGGTGIEALYFARFGTDFLPYLYMGLGLLSLFTSLAISGLLGRVQKERVYVFTPLIAAGCLAVAWGLLFTNNALIFPALWLAKEALNSIISLIAWNTAGAVCDARQAKRLFPLFNAARILGSVLGGLGTGLLANLFGAQNLILAWMFSMLATFLMARLLTNRAVVSAAPRQRSRAKRRAPSFIQEVQQGWQYVRKSELMRWVSGAAILFSILYFSIALPFSQAATLRYPNENELAAFLGLFNGLSTAAAFLTSLFAANRLFARFGIMSMILVLPAIYLLGFGGLIFFNVFAVIAAFRFMQTSWLASVADSAWQTMFSAVPPEKRAQVNAFINGVPEQMGVFLAGGILLVGEQSFTSQQLYFTGFAAAVVTIFIIGRASSAYRRALVDTLREGRPTLFDQPRGTDHDAITIEVLIKQLHHPDSLIRQLAADMLGETYRADALIPALEDEEMGVRVAALKGLAQLPEAAPHILPLLADPEPAARRQAVRSLRTLSARAGQTNESSHTLDSHLTPLLHDSDTFVQIEAALGLLILGAHDEVRAFLRNTAIFGSVDERTAALNAMAEWGDREAFLFIANEMDDRGAPSTIRRAAALALSSCGRDAIPRLIRVLGDEDSVVCDGAALALAYLGEDSLPSLLAALEDPTLSDGALASLTNFSSVSVHTHLLKEFSARKIESAIHFDQLGRGIPLKNERYELLEEALQARALQDGLRALRAVSLFSDRESIAAVIENLQSREPAQRAYALETLESARESRLIRPLFQLWDSSDSSIPRSAGVQDLILSLLHDSEAWMRACAAFTLLDQPETRPMLETLAETDPLIRDLLVQGEPMYTYTTLPIMERVLLLRRVPLLADLSPNDLQRVAALATELRVDPEEVFIEQDEPGNEMFVIIHGQVRIMVRTGDGEKEFARRGLGEVIGEMALLSGGTRSASVIAVEETRLLCLDRKSFESLLRERPEVGLAVMRVLCKRLKEATR